MDEQKNQEQPELNEAPEEYSFLQEVIKDEAGGPKRLKAKRRSDRSRERKTGRRVRRDDGSAG